MAADDAEIAALEKKLGIKSTKRSKAFADDGLDDLLEGLDDDDDEGIDGTKRNPQTTRRARTGMRMRRRR